MANKTGIAYHQLADLDNARKYYERAIKLSPSYAEAINNLGTVYYARKSYRRAISQYRKALELRPGFAPFLANLGTAYFARKQYAQASMAYFQALARRPGCLRAPQHPGHRGSGSDRGGARQVSLLCRQDLRRRPALKIAPFNTFARPSKKASRIGKNSSKIRSSWCCGKILNSSN